MPGRNCPRCGQPEHNPTKCLACQEHGSWADTPDTIAWFQAHANQITHLWVNTIFEGSLTDCVLHEDEEHPNP